MGKPGPQSHSTLSRSSRAEDSDGEAEREVADCGIGVVRKEINAVVSRCPAQVMPTPHHSSLRHDVALGTG